MRRGTEDGAGTLPSLHQPLPAKRGFQILDYLNSDASLHHMTLHVTCNRVVFAAVHADAYTADLSCFPHILFLCLEAFL